MGKLSGFPSNSSPVLADLFPMIQAAGPTDVKVTLQDIISFLGSNLYTPYKFSVYRNAAATSSTTPSVVGFDTALYDTGSNVDLVTNKGRFTAPIAGYYHFSASVGNSASVTNTQVATHIYKNGVLAKLGASYATTVFSHNANTVISCDLKLAVNDYIEVYFVGGSGTAIGVGLGFNYFDGHLFATT